MIQRETPDQIMVLATLRDSGAPFTLYLRGGKQFKDTPAVSWRVYGTKGEISVTSQAPISLSVGNEKIEIYDHGKDTVETVDYQYVDAVKDLPPMAKNIGGLYELYANGGDLRKGYVTFEEAVGMHRTLAAIEKSSEQKHAVKIAS